MEGENLPLEGFTAIMIAGFSMGIAGGLHCIGMCSPLVMAATQGNQALAQKFIYNSGRIFTYTILGAVVGVLGFLFELTAIQKYLSFFLGAALIVLGISGYTKMNISGFGAIPVKLTNRLKELFAQWLKRRNFLTTALLGFLNGLLPCGLTYMALAYTLTLSNSFTAGVFMFSFGLGTFPVMVGFPYLAGILGTKYAKGIKRFNTAILILLGIFLIWRSYHQFHSGMDQTM